MAKASFECLSEGRGVGVPYLECDGRYARAATSQERERLVEPTAPPVDRGGEAKLPFERPKERALTGAQATAKTLDTVGLKQVRFDEVEGGSDGRRVPSNEG